MTDSPRIYVACLASYNAGKLRGKWIDADQSAQEIEAEIGKVLASSTTEGAEEYAILDHEGFGSFEVREYEDIRDVSAMALALKEHGEPFAAYCSHVGYGEVNAEAVEKFQEAYQGQWDSLEAFAENLLEDTGDLQSIPEHLRPYFDFEAYARDLECGGDYFITNGGHVFRGDV